MAFVFSDLNITVDVISGNTKALPMATTCGQRMSIPLYPTKKILKRKLLQAIQCQGYGLGWKKCHPCYTNYCIERQSVPWFIKWSRLFYYWFAKTLSRHYVTRFARAHQVLLKKSSLLIGQNHVVAWLTRAPLLHLRWTNRIFATIFSCVSVLIWSGVTDLASR